MKDIGKTKIIILIGPPGCGKGTQAELIAERFNFYYFETSKIIENKFSNASAEDLKLQEIKKDWKSGLLVDPELVKQWVGEEINILHDSGKNIVIAGSPRTLAEAEAVIPLLENLYGREAIKIFEITLSAEESFNRNTNRRICTANRHPIPNFEEFKNITKCPKDGSGLIRREGLDDPESLARRDQQYRDRTLPMLDYLKDRGYNVATINGQQQIEKVNEDIVNNLIDDN
jgi:adenylate kinase